MNDIHLLDRTAHTRAHTNTTRWGGNGRNDGADETKAEAAEDTTTTANSNRSNSDGPYRLMQHVWLLAVELAAAVAAVAIRRRTHHGPLMSIQLVPRLLFYGLRR